MNFLHAPALKLLLLIGMALTPPVLAQANPGPISWRYVGYAETQEWWLEYETLPGWNYLIEQSQNLQSWEPMPGGFAYGDGGVKRKFITHGAVPPEPGSSPLPEPPPPSLVPPKTGVSITWTVTLSADPASSTVHLKREADFPDHPAWDTVLHLPLPRPSSLRICFLLDYEDESHFYWNTPTVKLATVQAPQPIDTLPSAGAQEESELAVFQAIVNQLTAYLSHDQANPNPPTLAPGPHKYVRIRRILADSNRNGIPDWQELQYGFPVLTQGINPNDDWDGDGITNAVEFATGTNPRVADAAPVNLVAADHHASLHQCVLTDTPASTINSETAWNRVNPAYSGAGPGTVTAATLNTELDAIWSRAPSAVAGNGPFGIEDMATSALTAYVTGQYSSGATTSAFSPYGSSFATIIDGTTQRYRIKLTAVRPPPAPVERNFLTILRKQPNGWNPGNTPPPTTGWIYYQEAMVTRSLQPAAATGPVASAEANIPRPAIDTVPDGKQMRNERTLAEVSLRADTSRNGTIDPADYHTHQAAVYVVNYNRDQGGRLGLLPLEDAVKWVNTTPKDADDHYLRYPDGEVQNQITATNENWNLEATPAAPLAENPAQLAPLRIAPIAFAKPDMKVFLRLPKGEEAKAKAFHLYLVQYTTTGTTTTKSYIPIWGGITSSAAPTSDMLAGEVDLSQYLNPQAPGYTETRAPATLSNPYPHHEFVLEGILFKGMPYPNEDGIASYGHSSSPNAVFDGVLPIALEFRAAGSAHPIGSTAPVGNGMATGGMVSWATLTCAPSLNFSPHPQHRYLVASPAAAPLLAFEGYTPETTAQGYGKYALGGRYGHVFTVTNNTDYKLNATPAATETADTRYHSLRYAIDSPVPRTILFALPEGMDGNIFLKTELVIHDRQCTIAAQTAFRNGSPGMCLQNHGLTVDADDVIVRHLRSRPWNQDNPKVDENDRKYGGNTDCLCVDGVATRVIFDRCSASFSSDCLLDVVTARLTKTDDFYLRPNRRITAQNCLLAWPMDKANHWEGGTKAEEHAYGGQIRAGNGAGVTFWRNFYGHIKTRIPAVSGLLRGTDDTLGLRLDFTNNIIYGWGDKGSTQVKAVAGYAEGNLTSVNSLVNARFWHNHYRMRVYATANQKRWFKTSNQHVHATLIGNSQTLAPSNLLHVPYDQYADPPIDYEVPGTEATFRSVAAGAPWASDFTVPAAPISSVPYNISVKVGASLKRDFLDLRLLGVQGSGGEYTTGAGTIIDSPSVLGGWPSLSAKAPPPDTDGDGLPDQAGTYTEQNTSQVMDPANALLDLDQDGYTNLEEYLNAIAQ